MAGCLHYWDLLPDLAREFYEKGGSIAELRGCIRHLVVLAGYGPCLAAMLKLQKASLLPEDTPAKCGGLPGNAFELVYATITDAVRRKVHSADPALGEWIRMHLYGDVYSSPGLTLREKQLLMCAALAEADMAEQLFGHALAGMRFGLTSSQIEEAIHIAFDMSARTRPKVLDEALKTVQMSKSKFVKDGGGKNAWQPPDITIPDESYVCIPSLPPLFNESSKPDLEQKFVWEELLLSSK